MKVRTRLAPSPTGYMHIGTLRTALYTWLFTRQHNGSFILRIEDTDQKRLVEDAVQAIIDGLHWAGFDPDEGPGIGGEFGPYVQSERLELYHEHTMHLIEKGEAYRCFCTSEDLDLQRKEQIAMKKQPMYDRRCRNLSEQEIAAHLEKKTPFVVRLKIPYDGEVVCDDMIRGVIKVSNHTLDDFVLMKTDGFPTYHLAMAVDDHFMEITHVTRTEEWLPSLPKHILLYKAFGWDAPTFAHMPVLLNKDRTKLSKRKGDVSLTSYINKGYLKDALMNYLALLGWNTSDDREIFTMEELLKEFSMERVHKAGAVVDTDKLDWINAHYIRNRSIEQLEKEILDFCAERSLLSYEDSHVTHCALGTSLTRGMFRAIVQELQTRLIRLDEFMDLTTFFFASDLSYAPTLLQHEKMKVTPEVLTQSLPALREHLVAFEGEWNRDTLKETLIPFIADLGLKNGQVLWPLRAALTGEEKSPGAFEVAEILGKEKTIERLEKAIALL